MEIKIYTDGACVGNPGPGGWAAIVLLENEKKELFGGEKSTTNNRMELTAAIKALEYCTKQKEELFGGEKLTTNNRMELTAAIKALEHCAKQKKRGAVHFKTN